MKTKTSKEGVVPMMVRPTTRTKLKNYKAKIAAKNWSDAIEQLLQENGHMSD